MRALPILYGLLVLIALPAPQDARAAGCAADAMLVFDGSASMSEIGFDTGDATRIEEARQAVRDALPQIAPYRRVGLVIYGPGPGDTCRNIDLRFAPRADAAGAIIGEIDAMVPTGLTALTASVARAAETLGYRDRPGIVVLVTDGNETCGGRPCALGDRLAVEARDLIVHVIGFRVVVDFFSWDNPEQQAFAPGETVARCLADRTGGRFVTTETVDELAAALRDTLGCPLIGQRVPAVKAPHAAEEG
jgi:Ca-activated chloride channel family protein